MEEGGRTVMGEEADMGQVDRVGGQRRGDNVSTSLEAWAITLQHLFCRLAHSPAHIPKPLAPTPPKAPHPRVQLVLVTSLLPTEVHAWGDVPGNGLETLNYLDPCRWTNRSLVRIAYPISFP